MNEPARPLATYDDILALPESLVGEILNSELYTHPRPAPWHARAYSSLGGNLGSSYDWDLGGPGGWWILDEPELHLGRDVVVPDLTGWRCNRMPILPETAWFELAPDWACKILSLSTARVDRTLKMSLYAREGVAHLWLVDPDVRVRWRSIAAGGALAAAHHPQGRRPGELAAVRCHQLSVGESLGVGISSCAMGSRLPASG